MCGISNRIKTFAFMINIKVKQIPLRFDLNINFKKNNFIVSKVNK